MGGPTPPTPPGYELLTPIGHGAGSVVWKAVQLSTGRWIALKILDADPDDDTAWRRIDPARHAMAALTDQVGIVATYDAGVHEGRGWVATELCRRGSLAAHVAATDPLDVGGALVVLARLADALAAAHDAGIVHGDVTPENVMLTDHGEPALRDVGVGHAAPRPADLDHLAPEVLAGEAPSPRSDVYALGTTVWELLAGFPPGLPDVPPTLFALLSAMTAPSSAERVPSMVEVAQRTRTVASELGLSTTAGLALPPLPALDLLSDPDDLGDGTDGGAPGARAHVAGARPWRSPRATVALAIATVVLAVVGTTTAIAQAGRHPAAPTDLGVTASDAPAAPPPGTSALPVPVSEATQEKPTPEPTPEPTTTPRATPVPPRPAPAPTTRRTTTTRRPTPTTRPSATRAPARNTRTGSDDDSGNSAVRGAAPGVGGSGGIGSSNQPPSGTGTL